MSLLRTSTLLAVATAAGLAAGCGSGYGGGSKSTRAASTSGNAVSKPGKTVAIAESEYKLTPSSVNVSATGTYTFKVQNKGTIAHALEIEGNGVEQKTGDIQPGSSATLTVDLTKNGKYELYCPIDGHRRQGMEGTVMVGSSAGGGTTTDTTSTDTGGGGGY